MVPHPVLCTFTGKVVNPLKLKMEDIDIHDIAHHLALINRFVGASKKPISVAQHSVYVMRLVAKNFRTLAREALLHDASEAYLGDVSKWVKASKEMAAYRAAEEDAEIVIAQSFNLKIYWEKGKLAMHPLIKEADNLMVRFEAMKMWGPSHPMFTLKDYPPPTKDEISRVGKWAPWSWKESEEVFLAHARMEDLL